MLRIGPPGCLKVKSWLRGESLFVLGTMQVSEV